jgi:arginine repressor
LRIIKVQNENQDLIYKLERENNKEKRRKKILHNTK